MARLFRQGTALPAIRIGEATHTHVDSFAERAVTIWRTDAAVTMPLMQLALAVWEQGKDYLTKYNPDGWTWGDMPDGLAPYDYFLLRVKLHAKLQNIRLIEGEML